MKKDILNVCSNKENIANICKLKQLKSVFVFAQNLPLKPKEGRNLINFCWAVPAVATSGNYVLMAHYIFWCVYSSF